jgi:hypothetical protein
MVDIGIVGSYTFLPVGTASTVVTFKLDVTIPFAISKRLAQYMTGVVMRKELKGFKKFVEAKAAIDGKSVLVWSDAVAKPVSVRFGWRQDSDPNLMNREGLPASCFRTDKWN